MLVSIRKIVSLAVLLVLPLLTRAQLLVDCSGSNPNAYPTINVALGNATPGSSIIVTGTCNENVPIQGMTGLNLGAWWGHTATINGTVSINNSTLIYLYGLNMTSPSGDGVAISSSRSVVLDTCTSNGNAGVGLRVNTMSDVTVATKGVFDNNAGGGINIFGNSLVTLGGWGGVIDISNNVGPGVWSSQASLNTLGNTSVTNNQLGSPGGAGLGVQLLGGSRFQFGGIYGPNLIENNVAGGASLGEESEISFFSLGAPNIISSNGPIGVSVSLGSQATFFGDAEITNHSDVGVDVSSNSQANFSGGNKIAGNGSSSNPKSAGIRVDGNSEAFLRGGNIVQNNGPGLLALVNSSLDFTGVTFSSNSGGIVTCDSSSYMISDLTGPDPGASCITPHHLGNRHVNSFLPSIPDLTGPRAMQAKYKKIAVRK